MTVTFDGSAGLDTSTDPHSNGKYLWEAGNWTLGGTPGLTAVAAIGQDGHVGGRGGVDMIVGGGAQVYHNHNNAPLTIRMARAISSPVWMWFPVAA